jgi:glycosyltransferase involved in cell wall biosynthesis
MSLESARRHASDGLPVVGIFRSPLFNFSETFIQAQGASLGRYQPVFIGLEDKGNVQPMFRERIVLPHGRAERLGFRLLGRCGTLPAQLKPRSPVLIHAHFGTDGLLALPLARALAVPLITTLHGYDVNRTALQMLVSGRISWTKYSLLRHRLLAGGHLFLAVSEALKRKAIEQGYPPERIVTHYIGVDLARFRNDGAEPQSGLVLHVGRLVEKKGTRLLLQAFAKVKAARKDACLTIIGEGPLRKRLEARSAELGLSASVNFLGAQPGHVVADWMRRAWLLAAPSMTASDGDAEGLPLVVCEAAAASLPVVASRHAGIPEAVDHGKTGFIVPEGESDPLAAHMLQLLESSALRASMARCARAAAEQRFDLVRQSSLLEEHYDRVVNQGRHGVRREGEVFVRSNRGVRAAENVPGY